MIPAGCAARHSAAARAVARLAALSDGRSSSACRSCSCSLQSGNSMAQARRLNRLDRGSKRYTPTNAESKKAKLTVHAVRSHRGPRPAKWVFGFVRPTGFAYEAGERWPVIRSRRRNAAARRSSTRALLADPRPTSIMRNFLFLCSAASCTALLDKVFGGGGKTFAPPVVMGDESMMDKKGHGDLLCCSHTQKSRQ